MMDDEHHNHVKRRLNSLYRDVMESEHYTGYGLSHSAEVICDELEELVEYVQKNLLDVDLTSIHIRNSPGSFGDRGFMQHVKTNIRKIADVLKINLDLDTQDEKPQTVFTVNQIQNVSQYASQTFSSMISNINQLDLNIKIKQEVLELVKEFKDKSVEEHPNTSKLIEIFNKIKNKSKEAAAMLSYWATITGTMDLLSQA